MVTTGGDGFTKTGEVFVKPVDNMNILPAAGAIRNATHAVNGLNQASGYEFKRVDVDSTPEKREAYSFLDKIPKNELQSVKNYLRGIGPHNTPTISRLPKNIKNEFTKIRNNNIEKLITLSRNKRDRIDEFAKKYPDIIEKAKSAADIVKMAEQNTSRMEGSILTPKPPKSQRALVAEKRPSEMIAKRLRFGSGRDFPVPEKRPDSFVANRLRLSPSSTPSIPHSRPRSVLTEQPGHGDGGTLLTPTGRRKKNPR